MCYDNAHLKEEGDFLGGVLTLLDDQDYMDVRASVIQRLRSVQEQRAGWVEMDEELEQEIKIGVENAYSPVD